MLDLHFLATILTVYHFSIFSSILFHIFHVYNLKSIFFLHQALHTLIMNVENIDLDILNSALKQAEDMKEGIS